MRFVCAVPSRCQLSIPFMAIRLPLPPGRRTYGRPALSRRAEAPRRLLSPPVDSQRALDQNNPYAKVGYLGAAYFDPTEYVIIVIVSLHD